MMPTNYFSEIIARIHNRFDVAPRAEITIESNPGTLDAVRLDEFIAAGVNRLSIGVQSLNDDELGFLGRRHNVADAMRLLDAAMARNIQVSADFIYGLPGHNAKTVEKLCRDINKIGLTHCSMYELTIEPNTPFGKMNLDMPTNDEMADMYNTVGDTLAIPRYEISNYATPGHECQHNQNVWDGGAYIGIGRGAAGRVFINNTWYEQLGVGERFNAMTARARATEKILTGLRQTRGLLLAPDVENALDFEYIKQNPELVEIAHNRVHATKRGMLVLDDLILNLVN